MSFLANRMTQIVPSPIMAMVARANALAEAGRSIIDLGIGEPDFPTVESAKRAGIAAIENDKTGYTPSAGIRELRQAIVSKFWRENGVAYNLDQIHVAAGGKQAIFNAMLATVDAGDEVIVPAPYWASYPDIVRIAGGTPVILTCHADHGFKLQPEALERAITPRTKWFVLNSPSNPTGAAYSERELRALAAVLLNHPHVHVLADDMYEHLVFGTFQFRTMAWAEPKLYPRTLIVNGVSKAYSMTGWRLGFAGGTSELIRAMNSIQGHSTTHPSSITQAAATAALTGPQDDLPLRRKIFEARRDYIVKRLNAMSHISCTAPEGAFYVYPSVGEALGHVAPGGKVIETDTDLCAYLLEHAGVSTVPGSGFGLSPFIRISYAASERALEEACDRIEAALAALQRSS
ncbi:MAG: pyridoxal phosphate-dependent aminotransferase [Hyphomonadaceae bacterium]|nr:pyridoxal phosphate-dependent aminotransferase [Hyphomonadaceae bacterium]